MGKKKTLAKTKKAKASFYRNLAPYAPSHPVEKDDDLAAPEPSFPDTDSLLDHALDAPDHTP